MTRISGFREFPVLLLEVAILGCPNLVPSASRSEWPFDLQTRYRRAAPAAPIELFAACSIVFCAFPTRLRREDSDKGQEYFAPSLLYVPCA
jgi:hypothetical protein